MENTLSVLRYLPTTKGEVASFAEKAKREILAGNQNVGDLILLSKFIDLTMEAIFKSDEVKKLFAEEIAKYPKGQMDYKGARVSMKSRRTWNFKASKKWCELYDQMAALELTMKSIKTEVADTETGEITPPATFTESDYIEIKFQP